MFPHLDIDLLATLGFYLLDFTKSESQLFVKENYKNFRLSSGIKDLILESSGEKLEFIHYTNNSCKESGEINTNMKFMTCCPENSKLSRYFQENEIVQTASSSVIGNFVHQIGIL